MGGVNAGPAAVVIAEASGLSKSRVKDAMAKGAVRLRRGGSRLLRRATFPLRSGDVVDLYYDPRILAAEAPLAQPVADEGDYSVWCKPPGLLTQGTHYGDHCSLVRQVEKRLGPRRGVHLVHRLDREAAGLIVLAHTRAAAAALSELFQNRAVTKRYHVQVLGEPADAGAIDTPLDGQSACTRFEVLYRQPGRALLVVTLYSGRKHQIRRHLAGIGHPVLGDPVYGQGNKHPDGLQLVASQLAFPDPFTGASRRYALNEPERGCASSLA